MVAERVAEFTALLEGVLMGDRVVTLRARCRPVGSDWHGCVQIWQPLARAVERRSKWAARRLGTPGYKGQAPRRA